LVPKGIGFDKKGATGANYPAKLLLLLSNKCEAANFNAAFPLPTAMKRIEKSIEIKAPLRTVYDQWTQFESFPLFMPGVLNVRQMDDRHVFWQVEVLGREVEWEAEIYEQIPDCLIAWRSILGRPHSGAIFFEPMDDRLTRLRVVVEYQLQGAAERLCDWFGAVQHRVERDLTRFRHFIEVGPSQPAAGWRGRIPQAEMQFVGIGDEQWTRY
jgi:uncharacterized membrane protein